MFRWDVGFGVLLLAGAASAEPGAMVNGFAVFEQATQRSMEPLVAYCTQHSAESGSQMRVGADSYVAMTLAALRELAIRDNAPEQMSKEQADAILADAGSFGAEMLAKAKTTDAADYCERMSARFKNVTKADMLFMFDRRGKSAREGQ